MDPIYQEELKELYKNPPHKGRLRDASTKVEEKNPLCGDNISLQIKIHKGKIEKARFDGAACAVSILSSEKLLDYIEGKTLEEARTIDQEDLLKILGIDVSMSRLKCATLVLKALKTALKDLEA